MRPKKNGAGLPVTINIIAVAVVVGSFFGASELSDRRQSDLTVRSREFATPEGRLIAEIRRETEARLEQKDAEIQRIQSELVDLDAERSRLQGSIEQELVEREATFEQALAQQLALERTRLEALGRGATDIETTLQDLQVSVESEQAQQLQAFRDEAESALAAKDTELAATRRLTEQILEEARLERNDLAEERALREEELVARYEEEAQRLAERTSEAEDELTQIADARERETLINDQIIGTYALVEERLSLGEYQEAMRDLDQLEEILLDPVLQEVPIIASRRNAELFLIDSLGTFIEMQAAADEQQSTDSIIETANTLSSSRGIISRGDRLYSDGDLTGAAARYREAIRLLPAVSRAVNRIDEIEQTALDVLILEDLELGGELLTEGFADDALAEYRNAALTGAATLLSRQAVESLSSTAAKIRSDDAIGAAEAIAVLQNQLENAASTIAVREATIRNRDDELSRARETIRLRSNDIERLEETIARRGSTIDTVTSDLEDEKSRADSIESALQSERSRHAETTGSLLAAEEEIVELRSEIAQREQRILTLQESLRVATNSLRQANDDAADLRSDLSETESNLGRALSDLESSWALSEETRADASNAAARAAEAASQAASEADARESALGDRVTQLEAALNGSQVQVASLLEAVVTLRSDLAAADVAVDEGETRVASLLGELDKLQASVSSLQTENALLSTQANAFAARASELEAAAAAISVLDETDLIERYAEFKIENEIILDGLAVNRFELASADFAEFLSGVGDRAFPDISSVRSRILVGLLTARGASASESGGRSALNEVLRYVAQISLGENAPVSARLAFEALAAKDLLYRRVFDSLDQLGGNISGPAGKVLRLIGEVVDFGEGVVEIAIDEGLEPEESVSVLIRRVDRDGEETPVAQGILRSVDGDTGLVEIRLYLDPTPPGAGDRAYAETTVTP